MIKKRSLLPLIFGLGLAAILLLVFLLKQPAFQSDQQRDQVALDNVARVTIHEVKRALEAGEALVVDVRSRANYDYAHIRGAISAPLLDDLDYRIDAPLNAVIYLYCT